MKLRIAVISSTVFPCPPSGYAGLEAISYHCANGLGGKGHDVTLYAPDGSQCPNGRVRPFGPPGQVSEKQVYSQTWQELNQFDVIVSHNWQAWEMIGKGEGWVKAPVLKVLHAPVNTMLGSLPPNVPKPCFVCISEDQKNHFEALFSPAKARVCYNGVDVNHYAPIEGIKRSDRFLFLARFSRIKGAAYALRACLEAGVGLDLIGDTQITNEPEYLAECRALAEQTSPTWDRSKGKQLRIIGGVSRGECVWWLSQAHALLHPNELFREPFGLAPVEAQLCGCPVIAWDYGAMRETVQNGVRSSDGKSIDGGTGFLVSSYEDLVSTITFCKEIPDAARVRCREWAKRFSIEAMVQRYHDLCVEAVETGGW